MRTRTVPNRPHALVVLKIVERDEHGRPRRAEIVYDEERIAIEDGDEFVTAYVPAHCIAKTSS